MSFNSGRGARNGKTTPLSFKMALVQTLRDMR